VLNTLLSDLGFKKTEFTIQGLCAFANSAMNVEYVYLILISIEQFYSKKNTSSIIKVDKDG